MANRKALVLVNGEPQLLQVGDTLVDNLGNVLGAVLGGSGNPGAIGKAGDLYINSVQGDIWYNVAGTWTLYGANAYYLQGFSVAQTVPTTGQLLAFDGAQWSPATVIGGGGTSSQTPDPFLNPPYL